MNKVKIENILMELGVPSSIKGFRYIVDAVMYLDSEESSKPYWTEIYTVIGEKNKTTASRTERAIRHALTVCRNRCKNLEALDYYIGGRENTNSNSLMQLHTRLRQEDDQIHNIEIAPASGYLYITREELKTLIREEVTKVILKEIERQNSIIEKSSELMKVLSFIIKHREVGK